MVLKPFQMPSDEKWDRGEYWSAWLNLERFRLLEYAKLPSQWNSFGIILTPRWKKIIKTNVLTEVSLQCYCKATHSFPQGVCAGSTRVLRLWILAKIIVFASVETGTEWTKGIRKRPLNFKSAIMKPCKEWYNVIISKRYMQLWKYVTALILYPQFLDNEIAASYYVENRRQCSRSSCSIP